MEAVTCYKASDGKVFESKEEALNHESKTLGRRELMQWLDSVRRSGCQDEAGGIEPSDFANKLVEQRETAQELVKLLRKIHRLKRS